MLAFHINGYERILVPTDGSESSEEATDHALDVVQRHDATADALFVVDEAYPAVSHWDVVVEEAE